MVGRGRRQARDGLTVPVDEDLFAVLHKVQEARKLGLGLVNAYFDHPGQILI